MPFSNDLWSEMDAMRHPKRGSASVSGAKTTKQLEEWNFYMREIPQPSIVTIPSQIVSNLYHSNSMPVRSIMEIVRN